MADSSYTFRTALAGFHKGDVTAYIEKTASQHRSELLQYEQTIQTLQEENRSLQQQMSLLMMTMPVSAPAPAPIPEPEPILVAEPDPEPVPVAEPELVCEAEPEAAAETASADLAAMELQAYRRAEAVERNANNRARKLYQQMEGVCEEALGGFQNTDSAVKEAIEVMMAQTAAIEQVYQKLSAALLASREKLVTMTDLLCCEEEE